MPTSLVTGGAGFLGSHVAERLLDRGHDVVILDNLSGGFVENLPHDALFVQGSILDARLIDLLFDQYRIDYVFHLAAYAAEGLSHFIKRFNYENNVIGTVNLINASVNHHIKHFVFTSSIAVYGPGQVPFKEDTIPAPEDSYGIAKWACEQELQVTRRMFGLNYTVFRPHNVYGERQNISDSYRNVVGIFMNRILSGEPMPIFGDGTQQRAFTYIDDIAPLIAGCVDIPAAHNETFNIGANEPWSVNELATIVAEAMASDCHIEYLPERSEVKVAYSDHSKAAQVFGPSRETSIEIGVRRMAKWVKEQGPRPPITFEGIEISRNLPPSWARMLTT